jgi:hypothetical protein
MSCGSLRAISVFSRACCGFMIHGRSARPATASHEAVAAYESRKPSAAGLFA